VIRTGASPLRRLGLLLLVMMLCLSHGGPAAATLHEHDLPTHAHATAGVDLIAADDHAQTDAAGDMSHPPGHLHLCAAEVPASPELADRLPVIRSMPLVERTLPLGSLAAAPPVQPPSA